MSIYSKMSRTTNVLILISFLLIKTSLVEPLECYTCTGLLNSKAPCQVDLDRIPSPKCEDVCARYVIKNPGHELLTRSCAPEGVCQVLETTLGKETLKECRTCEEDRCNTGNSIVSSLSLSLGMFVLCRLFANL